MYVEHALFSFENRLKTFCSHTQKLSVSRSRHPTVEVGFDLQLQRRAIWTKYKSKYTNLLAISMTIRPRVIKIDKK